jgi:hypothetical protein
LAAVKPLFTLILAVLAMSRTPQVACRNHRAAKSLSWVGAAMNRTRIAIEAVAAKYGATCRFLLSAGGCLAMVALTITTAHSVRSCGVPLHVADDQSSHEGNLRRVESALQEMAGPRVFISPGLDAAGDAAWIK